MKVNRHTAIQSDNPVRVTEPRSIFFGHVGFVFAVDSTIPYAWVQFGHEKQFAQAAFHFDVLEMVDPTAAPHTYRHDTTAATQNTCICGAHESEHGDVK